MILVKKQHFLHFRRLGKNHLEIMCGDLFDRKNRFWPLKMCTSDSRTFAYFPKGLTHDYRQKTEFFFQYLSLSKNELEIIIGDHLDRKKSFLALKNLDFR